jgi:hypothetical protein
MFKVVDGSDVMNLRASLAVAVVDIQLVDDALATDVSFVHDKSKPKVGSPGMYTYTSLVDTISRQEICRIRKFVFRVLSHLTGSTSFLCFLTGESLPAECVSDLQPLFSIHAHYEESDMGGKLRIVEMDLEEFEFGVECLGYFDSVRGVAIRRDSKSHDIIENLPLCAPVPTTDPSLPFQPPRPETLRLALKYGELFFEEIGNGTRLRIISAVLGQDALEAAIVGIVSAEQNP